jgi:hypothetical protein
MPWWVRVLGWTIYVLFALVVACIIVYFIVTAAVISITDNGWISG